MKQIFYFLVVLGLTSCATEKIDNQPKPTKKVAKKVEKSNTASSTMDSASKNENYGQLAMLVTLSDDQAIRSEAEKLQVANPNDVKLFNVIAMSYYRSQAYENAQFNLNKALQIQPNSIESLINLSLVQLAKGEKRNALLTLKKASNLKAEHPEVNAMLGMIYLQAKDYQKAQIAYDMVYKSGLKSSAIANNYAASLVGVKKYDQADIVYKEALSADQNNKEILFNYSIFLIEQLKRNQEGVDLLTKLKYLGPEPEMNDKINSLENLINGQVK